MPWEGSCNRCGLCCTQIVRGIPTRCENLRIVSSTEAVCAVYEDRTPWLKIRLLDANNRFVDWSFCTPTYPHPLEKAVQLPDKCGYRWVEPEPEPIKP